MLKVRHEISVFTDAEELAVAAADFVADLARRSVAAKGAFRFAVSGGRTPWPMFSELLHKNVPWAQTIIYQVDERVANPGDPARNLSSLVETLAVVDAQIEAMPVEGDLEAGARFYAELLPEHLDLVHLGLGTDGHTASLVPGDPVLSVSDRLVAITAEYQGHRRMTLTYPALARADQLLWLVSGRDKRSALALLQSRDPSIPAGRVEAARSRIMTDQSASSS